MKEILKIIDEKLTDELGLNYEFGEMTKTPITYPYWVGDYTDTEPTTEDGKDEFVVMLTGFARGKFIDLENQKQAIKDYFKNGVTVFTEAGSSVNIFYAGSLIVPSDEIDLKRSQINLKIKKWSV